MDVQTEAKEHGHIEWSPVLIEAEVDEVVIDSEEMKLLLCLSLLLAKVRVGSVVEDRWLRGGEGKVGEAQAVGDGDQGVLHAILLHVPGC